MNYLHYLKMILLISGLGVFWSYPLVLLALFLTGALSDSVASLYRRFSRHLRAISIVVGYGLAFALARSQKHLLALLVCIPIAASSLPVRNVVTSVVVFLLAVSEAIDAFSASPPDSRMRYLKILGEIIFSACLCLSYTMVSYLNFPPREGSDLRDAVYQDDMKAVMRLYTLGESVDCPDSQGRTPLHIAAQRVDVDMSRMLIKLGASVNPQDSFGFTPLHWLAQVRPLIDDDKMKQRQLQLAKVFLDHGADQSLQDKHGLTPAELAAKQGNVGLVWKFLRETNTDE